MNKKYGQFRIGDLFEAASGNADIKKSDINEKGVFVVSSGIENNGIIGKTDMPAKIFESNTITIDMFGNVFYRDFKYKMVTHARVFMIKPLNSKILFNKETALYIVAQLKWLSKVFSYDKMCTFEKIKNDFISLPLVDGTEDKIDFLFMSEKIREMEAEKIREMEAYFKVSGLNDCELTEDDKAILSLSSSGKKKYGEFRIGDIFEYLPVKKALKSNVNKEYTTEFCVPVVYAKYGDNGIMYWNKKNECTTYKNIISIVYNGAISAGKVYAQKSATGILGESYFIRIKNKNISFLSNLYLKTVIEHKIYPLYSRDNLAIWNNRVENEYIYLPLIDGTSDQIDFDYMEKYIYAMQKVVIADVVKYKDKMIEKTKEVIEKEKEKI